MAPLSASSCPVIHGFCLRCLSRSNPYSTLCALELSVDILPKLDLEGSDWRPAIVAIIFTNMGDYPTLHLPHSGDGFS